MAWLDWIGGNRRKQPGGLHAPEQLGYPLVVGLAREELRSADPEQPAVRGWDVAKRNFAQVCRSFGVALLPAADDLDGLDAYVLAPLRAASFLAVSLLAYETYQRYQQGVPYQQALEEISRLWEEDFGTLLMQAETRRAQPSDLAVGNDDTVSTAQSYYPPYSQPPQVVARKRAEEAAKRAMDSTLLDPQAARHRMELRTKQRQDMFASYGLEFADGISTREMLRVIFVTTLVVGDDARYAARKVAPEAADRTCYDTLRRFAMVTARLVADHDPSQQQSPS